MTLGLGCIQHINTVILIFKMTSDDNSTAKVKEAQSKEKVMVTKSREESDPVRSCLGPNVF